jgi:hypothetical protein
VARDQLQNAPGDRTATVGRAVCWLRSHGSPAAESLSRLLASLDGRPVAGLPPAESLPLPAEARDFDGLVSRLLGIQQTRVADLAPAIDACQSLLAPATTPGDLSQAYLHALSCNLIDIIKSLIKWDKTGSLKYLSQKVADEVSRVPFEQHLAMSLTIELSQPSAGSMFYFPYLDELLAFVENPSQFLRYYCLCSAVRLAAHGPSQLDSLAAYKIAAKFGDAADLSHLADSFKAVPTELWPERPPGLAWPSAVQVTAVAFHAEQLSFDFARLPPLALAPDPVPLEHRLQAAGARQFRLLPLVISHHQASCTLAYRGLEVLASPLFTRLVARLASESSVDISDFGQHLWVKVELQRLADLGLIQLSVV